MSWLRTGDTYVKDADGYYSCLGRGVDMLKPGGIWVSPAEVEARLLAQEAVAQAVVVAAHDADGLEKPVAFVILQPGWSITEAELSSSAARGRRRSSGLARWCSPVATRLPALGRSVVWSCARWPTACSSPATRRTRRSDHEPRPDVTCSVSLGSGWAGLPARAAAEPARGLADDLISVTGHPPLKPGVTGVVLRGRPDTQPVRAVVGADADQVEGLGAFPGLRCGVMREQHDGGPVPAGERRPDTRRALRDRGGGAGLGDHGQVAGLRTGGEPHAQMSNTLPGRCTPRVAPERLVGDQIPDRRQAVRRGGRQGLHRRILPVAAPCANDPSQLAFNVYKFDPGQMAEYHRAPDSDRLLTARLMGVANRHAPWRQPTQDETDAAVPQLREIAGDRPDLLAEVAGILLGASEGELDEPRSKAAARFGIAAGADESLIPGWIAAGRRRVATRRKPPFGDPARRTPRHG